MEFTVEQILKEMVLVEDWLNNILGSKKVGLSRVPNIIKYIKLYKSEYPKFKEGKIQQIDHAEEMGVAIHESISLIVMKKGLSKLNVNHLPRKKILEAIGGAFHPFNENSEDASNQARNTLFELETAAHFILKGVTITGFNDTNFGNDFWDLSIQCKRLLSWGNLGRRIAEAHDQLVKTNKIQEKPHSYGMIALSLEKLYQVPGIRCLRDENEFILLLDKVNSEVTEKIAPYWKKYNDPKLIGMIYLFKFPIKFEKTGLSAKYKNLINFPPPSVTTPKVITDIQCYISNLRPFKLEGN